MSTHTVAQFIADHTGGVSVATGTTSVVAAGTSFFVATLPMMQWLAATVAIISGVIAILLGLAKIVGTVRGWLDRAGKRSWFR